MNLIFFEPLKGNLKNWLLGILMLTQIVLKLFYSNFTPIFWELVIGSFTLILMVMYHVTSAKSICNCLLQLRPLCIFFSTAHRLIELLHNFSLSSLPSKLLLQFTFLELLIQMKTIILQLLSFLM